MHINITAYFLNFFKTINHSHFLLLIKMETKAEVMLLLSFAFGNYLSIQILLIYLSTVDSLSYMDHLLCLQEVSSKC